VVGVQPGWRPIVLDAEVQIAALGVGEADDRLEELAVGQTAAIRLELCGQALGSRDHGSDVSAAVAGTTLVAEAHPVPATPGDPTQGRVQTSGKTPAK